MTFQITLWQILLGVFLFFWGKYEIENYPKTNKVTAYKTIIRWWNQKNSAPTRTKHKQIVIDVKGKTK